MARRHRGALAGLLAAAAVTLVAGCGGGGDGGGGRSTDLSGVVTNPAGQAVAGADVRIGGRHTTSLSNGTFVLPNIGADYQLVHAVATVNGRRYSGQTWVDVAFRQDRTVNVMVSEEARQGSIGGRVIGPDGFPLENVKVFVAGPIASTMGITDPDGYYVIDQLDPDFTYAVTASLAGYLNHSQGGVTVATGQTTTVSFALAAGTSQGAIPAPTGLQAQAWTVADTISRASGSAQDPYEWVKRLYRRKRGLPETSTARDIKRTSAGRYTPAGSVIEVDLFWTYQEYNDLLGYAFQRSTSSGASGPVVAIMRDPLAVGFFDVDPVLTPNVIYYYTAHRLDTVDFPRDGTMGPASSQVSAQPLEPTRIVSPAIGARVGAHPVLQWTAVPGATSYQVYVWDSFPALTDPADPNSAQLVWPVDVNSPGASLVQAPATSVTYSGPALIAGHTYYWMVVASDAGASTLSATQVGRFVD